jgi:hypothetical protein
MIYNISYVMLKLIVTSNCALPVTAAERSEA